MRLDSVNIGQPETLAGHRGLTGIFKQSQGGPVQVLAEEIAGDAVLDRKHHGGVDQAVYAYGTPDYEWWAGELGVALEPGTFGENLTIAGMHSAELAVGDRLAIGPVLLEVTSPRIPCNTLARRMDDRMFVKRFFAAGRPGAYFRVLVAGSVEAGMDASYTPFAGRRVSLLDLMFENVPRDWPADKLREALGTPLHWKLRRDFSARLAELEGQA